MHIIRVEVSFRLAVLAVALFMSASVLAQPRTLEEAMSYDGLQKISVKGLEMVYALPGSTLSGYTKVLIDPITVRFRKDWKPKATGSTLPLSSSEQQKIREDVAKIVYQAFVQELEKGGYSIVTSAGPDVLRVQAVIINLYVTAPDVMRPGRSHTFTTSSGEMTLLAELSDSDTGQVIARVLDRKQARSTGSFEISSIVSDSAEGRAAAAAWARILRSELDKAKDIGKH